MKNIGRLGAAALLAALIGTGAPASLAQGNRASYCAAEAERASRDSGSILGGSARSAARGAVFGAVVGGHESARRGATLGAVTGGVRRAAQKNDVYRYTYDDCMRRR